MALDFPSNPVNGQVYDNFYWDSSMSAWRASGNISPLIPAGVISQYAGSSAPLGYLLCTGQSLLASEYPALFQAIGYVYGGSGLNFTLPNMQHRVPVGRGTETEFDTLGETGGNKVHQLSINEMPSHTHTQDSHNHTQNAHGHNINEAWSDANATHNHGSSAGYVAQGQTINRGGTYSDPNAVVSATATNQIATAVNQNTGGGLAHNNLQPYIVLNYIIKT